MRGSPVRMIGGRTGAVSQPAKINIAAENRKTFVSRRNQMERPDARCRNNPGRRRDMNGTRRIGARFRERSAIRRVFQALFFYLSRILPDNVARPGVNQLETVEHIITGAL